MPIIVLHVLLGEKRVRATRNFFEAIKIIGAYPHSDYRYRQQTGSDDLILSLLQVLWVSICDNDENEVTRAVHFFAFCVIIHEVQYILKVHGFAQFDLLDDVSVGCEKLVNTRLDERIENVPIEGKAMRSQLPK